MSRHLIHTSLTLAAAGALFLLQACSQEKSATATAPPIESEVKRQAEIDAKQEALQGEFRAMQVPGLVERLEADSRRDVEPFNSVAYREVVSRGPALAKDLAGSIKAQDKTSFLSLLALREIDAETYATLDPQLKAAILTDALKSSPTFNAWGLPHLYWEDAANAVIETGEEAVPLLARLLEDQREAPLWGSEEAAESEKYKYRVKDYAWALIMQIRGQKTEIPTSPVDRDQLIATTPLS